MANLNGITLVALSQRKSFHLFFYACKYKGTREARFHGYVTYSRAKDTSAMWKVSITRVNEGRTLTNHKVNLFVFFDTLKEAKKYARTYLEDLCNG